MVPKGELDLATLARGLPNYHHCNLIVEFPCPSSSGNKQPPYKDLKDFKKRAVEILKSMSEPIDAANLPDVFIKRLIPIFSEDPIRDILLPQYFTD